MSFEKFLGLKVLGSAEWTAFVRLVAAEVTYLKEAKDAQGRLVDAIAARGLQVIEDNLVPILDDAGDKRDAIEVLRSGAETSIGAALADLATAIAQVLAQRDEWLGGILDADAVAETANRLFLTPAERTAIANSATDAELVAAVDAALAQIIGGAAPDEDSFAEIVVMLANKLSADFSGLVAIDTPSGAELIAVRDGATSKKITIAELLAMAGGGIDVGAVLPFAMETEPDGWLEADGSAISRAAYSELFAKIGTTYGVGDGSTTFNLPDYRGEFIRGWDHGRGVDSGRVFGSWQAAALGTHGHTGSTNSTGSHTHTTPVYNTAIGAPTGIYQVSAGSASSLATSASGNHSHTVTVDNYVGTETRGRNVAALICIRYQ